MQAESEPTPDGNATEVQRRDVAVGCGLAAILAPLLSLLVVLVVAVPDGEASGFANGMWFWLVATIGWPVLTAVLAVPLVVLVPRSLAQGRRDRAAQAADGTPAGEWSAKQRLLVFGAVAGMMVLFVVGVSIGA
ncbi:hypothetical protein AB0L88_16755 [Saccharopolyspora shandongensis]|uniref:Uncharacterized protein n=1 Tax=Saccharopolyspora shandongensis TaxID=418495 RepID=A0A1H3FJ23_9PSEU|nr:hypothetical protein [Saccharopolyspora shandongensis]SDX90787.1 hypothetical protein SAMN05216215_101729 [Saccharopolyspora shandongensis]